jgi:hypothetical protein
MSFLNNLKGGSGAPAAKWPTIGTSYEGEIIALDMAPSTNLNTGASEEVPVITLETSDGPVSIWVNKGALASAIKQAVVEARGSDLNLGDTLKVGYVADAEAKPGKSPAKLYKARYTAAAPKSAISVADF